MLTLIHSAARFICIRATGRLTSADYRRFEPTFAAELAGRHLPIPLLLDMRGFRGWTIGGFLRDLRRDVRHRSLALTRRAPLTRRIALTRR